MTKSIEQQLYQWLKGKDYSVIYNWSVGDFLEQLEIRLGLISDALRNSGHIDKDIRWVQINRHDIRITGSITNRLSTRISDDTIQLHDADTLQAFAEILNKRSSKLSRQAYAVPISDTEQNSVAYLASIGIDLSKPDDQILKSVKSVLPKIRELTGIPEPTPESQRQPREGAIRSFCRYRVIEYLDILLFLINQLGLNTLAGRKKPTLFANALNQLQGNHDNQLGQSDLYTWNRDFYYSKLFNLTFPDEYTPWFKSTLNQIRSDQDLLATPVAEVLNKN